MKKARLALVLAAAFSLFAVAPAVAQNTNATLTFYTPQDPIYDIYVAQIGAGYAFFQTQFVPFQQIYDSFTTVFFDVYPVLKTPANFTLNQRKAVLARAADDCLNLAMKTLNTGFVDFDAVFRALNARSTSSQGAFGDPGRSNYFAWCTMWYAYYAYLDLVAQLQALSST